MKIRSRVIIFCLTLLALCAAAYSQTYSTCPNCIKNLPVMPGHGPASTTDPRRVINLTISESWGTNTPASVWNAVCAGSPGTGCTNATGPSAINMWNSVGTWYFFQLNQSSGSAMDILIVRDSTWSRGNECAYTDAPTENSQGTVIGSSVSVIHLPPGSENWSQQQLACVIAHEIGHTIGLHHTDGSCPNSIMRPSMSGDCTANCTDTQIPSGDVEAANNHASDRTRCASTVAPRPLPLTGGGVTDPYPFRYNPICYFYYDEVDLYRTCLCERAICQCQHGDFIGVEYVGTVYILTDYFCY